MSLISELKRWRETAAAREGVELYRVLPNAALEEIAEIMPKTREELLSVKGIKEAKYRKYGKDILSIVARHGAADAIGAVISDDEVSDAAVRSAVEAVETVPDTLSVSQFLDALNLELSGMAARIRGEVSSVDERDRVVYFSLKDASDEATINCLIFRSAYVLSGVRIAVGDEIIVEGSPDIYKPNGRLSLKVGLIEFAGEGALKKAYEELRKKLETEGLFAPERKRAIPEFPEHIALLTSRDGAAIGDFMTNVGRHGYRISLYPSSVEGKRAVFELLAGVRYFNAHPERYDALVIIRGGGSLESLQGFNNEALVRAVADSKIPVIAGVGHEKDITLAALVADAMVSTPTAASRLVRQSWEEGMERVGSAEHVLRSRVSDLVIRLREALGRADTALLDRFQAMKERIRTIVERFLAKREALAYGIRGEAESVSAFAGGLKKGRAALFATASDALLRIEKLLLQFDPTRALNLGYSLVRLGNGRILRKSTDARVGDRLDIRLSEGAIGAEVKEVL